MDAARNVDTDTERKIKVGDAVRDDVGRGVRDFSEIKALWGWRDLDLYDRLGTQAGVMLQA